MEDGEPARPSHRAAAMVEKFKLVLDAVPYEIEHQGNLLLVDGQEFSCASEGDSVTVQGNTHTVEISGTTATVDGVTYPFEIIGLEEQKPRKARKATTLSTAAEAGAIIAIMPGLIVKVLKKVGDRVEVGEVVLILEAMKMQNELRAPCDGIVKKINFKEGDQVDAFQPIIELEEPSQTR
jgi:biotin carboxyl carrier protein